jgi:hypothetical protein
MPNTRKSSNIAIHLAKRPVSRKTGKLDTGTACLEQVVFYNMPDHFLCNLRSPDNARAANAAEILPCVISATARQSSIVRFTHSGIGTVRMRPPFPTRSTMAQWSSRR